MTADAPSHPGTLDRLPTPAQHLLIAVVPPLLAWIGTDVVPALQGRPGLALVLALLAQVVGLWVTPVTRDYGAGARVVPGEVVSVRDELATDEVGDDGPPC